MDHLEILLIQVTFSSGNINTIGSLIDFGALLAVKVESIV
jgi:hypothetical protein